MSFVENDEKVPLDSGARVPAGIFLSYAREDEARAYEIVGCLREYGLYFWIDASIAPGEEWEKKLFERVGRCAAMVVLMSPRSSGSEWVAREIDDAEKLSKPLFPLLLEGQGLEQLKGIQHEDVRGARLPSSTFATRLIRACRGEEALARTGSLARAPLPPRPRLPGRGDVLSGLLAEVFEGREGLVVDLRGLGGVGKTAVALKFLEAAHHHFDGAAWISLESPPSPEEWQATILGARGRLPAPDRPSSSSDVRQRLVDTLAAKRLLLVFDRAESLADDGGNAPPPHVSLLKAVRDRPGRSFLVFTSRRKLHPPARGRYRDEQLAGLGVVAARRLLEDEGLGLEEADVSRLVEHYGGLPFALVRAGDGVAAVGGDVEAFLSPGGGSHEVAAQIREQLDALPAPLAAGLEFLALAQGHFTDKDLAQVIALADARADIMQVREGLVDLGWLSGSETHPAPSVTRVVTDLLRRGVVVDLESGRTDTIARLPLLSAFECQEILEIQKVRLLEGSLELLRRSTGMDALERVRCLIATVGSPESPFVLGNLVNLLSAGNPVLDGVNVPGREIRNVDLRECEVRNSDFRRASLENVHFLTAMEGVTSLAMSPAGDVVAAGTANGELHLWEARTGELLQTVTGHRDVVTDVEFSEDGILVASSSDDGTVRVWDRRRRVLVRSFAGEGPFFAVALTPAGDIVAGGRRGGEVCVWELQSRGSCTRLETTGDVHSLSFDGRGKWLAAGSTSGLLKVWNRDTGKLSMQKEIGRGGVDSVRFIPGTTQVLVSTGGASRTYRWDVLRADEVLDVPAGLRRASHLRLARDGSLAVTPLDEHALEVVDLESGRVIIELTTPKLRMQHCVLSARSRLVAAGGNSHAVCTWDLDSGRLLWTAMGHSRWIKAVDISADGRLLACCADDEAVHVWDLEERKPVRVVRPHRGHIRNLVFARPGGRDPVLCSASDDRTVALFGIFDQTECELGPMEAGGWGLAVSSDERELAVGCRDGRVRVWSLGSRNCRLSLESGSEPVRSVAFSPDGRLLAAGGDDGAVRVWSLENGRDRESLVLPCRHPSRVWCVRFWPVRGHLLGPVVAGAGDDGVIRLWSVRFRKMIGRFESHGGTVWSLAFSPTRPLLASGSSDGVVRLWKIPLRMRLGLPLRVGAAELEEYRGHQGWARAVAFSADGQKLASGSHDGTVRIWGRQSESVVLPILRPYEGMDLRGCAGLSDAELSSLQDLGAIVDEVHPSN